MTLRLHSIVAAMLVATAAQGQWVGWPLATNSESTTWNDANTNYAPIGQLITGHIQRADAAAISPWEWVETWSVDAGTSNDVVSVTNVSGGVTNIYFYTNVYAVTTNVTTTNVFGTFPNPSGADSVTHIMRSLIQGMDSGFNAVVGYYVNTNPPPNGAFTNYFALTNSDGVRPSDFPLESKPYIFDRQGIGYTTTFTTNAWGHVSGGGNAYWTRAPVRERGWILGEWHWTGSAWAGYSFGTLDVSMTNSDIFPIVEYMTTTNNLPGVVTGIGGTNPPPGSWTFDAQSYMGMMAPGQSIMADSNGVVLVPNQLSEIWFEPGESVTVSGTIGQFTNRWAWLQPGSDYIDISENGANNGDVIRVLYTNDFDLIGAAADYVGYQLHAEDLDERQRALEPLVWTRRTASLTNDTSSTNAVGTYHWTGYGESVATTNVTTDSTSSAWPGALLNSSPIPGYALSGTVIYGSGSDAYRNKYGLALEFVVLSGDWRPGWSFRATGTAAGTVTWNAYDNHGESWKLEVIFANSSTNWSGPSTSGGTTNFSLAGSWNFNASESNSFIVRGAIVRDVIGPMYADIAVDFTNVTFTVSGLVPYIDAYRWNGAIAAGGITTNYACARDLYASADYQDDGSEVYTNYLWSPEISGVPDPSQGIGTNSAYGKFQYFLADTQGIAQTSVAVSDIGVLPVVIPDYYDSIASNVWTVGWRMEAGKWLLKWDVEGGFDQQ